MGGFERGTASGFGASLREGIEESFTVSKLGLPPLPFSSLGTSNMLECAHSRIRDKTRRLKNETQGKDVRRRAVAAFLDAQKTMRTLKAHNWTPK